MLAKRGGSLLLTGRNADRLAESEREYGVPGVVETLQVDATEPAGAQHAAAEAARRFGG